MKKITTFVTTLLLVSGTAVGFYTASANADVTVSLDAPDWRFSIHQMDRGGRKDRMSREEREFIHEIQPLLDNKDYAGIVQAYANLENLKISSSLKALVGQVMLGAEKYDKAKALLLEALEQDDAMPIAHRSLSMVFMVEQDYDNAKTHLVKAVELGAADAQLYGQLGYINLQKDKPLSAIAAYQNALMLEPDNTQWEQGLLFALIGSEGLPQAKALVTEMLNDTPDNARLWLQRSQIAMKQSDDVTAISSLEMALSLDSLEPENLASLAKLHVRSGSPSRAVDILSDNSKTLLVNTQNNAGTYFSIADWLVASQDWTNLNLLVSALESRIKTLSRSEEASLNVLKASVSLASNKEDEARRYLTKAVDVSPANGNALMSLATLYREARNDERAIMYYLRAQALPKFKERAKLGRAQVAINQKQYGSALSLLREVFKDNPGRSDLLPQ